MAPQTSTKLTYEDYLQLPDDGRRHEIIDGEHYVSPSPNTRHQRIAKRIVRALLPLEDAGAGEVFFAPYDVVLSMFDVVVPDVLFISAARRHIITTKNADGAPDLVVEILSESNRQYDKQVKFKIYERFGVSEFWIVDPDDEVVEVYRRDGPRFVRVDAGDSISSPTLPGLSVPVHKFFG